MPGVHLTSAKFTKDASGHNLLFSVNPNSGDRERRMSEIDSSDEHPIIIEVSNKYGLILCKQHAPYFPMG